MFVVSNVVYMYFQETLNKSCQPGSPRRGRQLFMIMPRGGLDFVRERSRNSATVFEAFRLWNAKKLSIFY